MSQALSNPSRPDPAARAAETLALTLWAEAASRPVRAIEALAALAVNRARLAAADEAARLRFAPGPAAAGRWPALLGQTCRAPFLFACWNPRHPRHAALGEAPEGDPALAVCRRIARRAAAGGLPDPTNGATHWHDAAALPGWALGRVPSAEVGGLAFYRTEGRGEGREAGNASSLFRAPQRDARRSASAADRL